MFFLFLTFSLFAQDKLETTQVTASPLTELGFSKTIKPSEEYLYPQDFSNLSDGLNHFSGLQTKTIGSPLISIRGSQSNSRVLVLLEGIPLNFADGVGYNPLFIPYENLESVSVLKGPSTATFGKDAMAGAVNFKTKNQNGLDFYTSSGSFNTKEAAANFGKNGFYISALQSHTDGNYPYRLQRTGVSGTLERNNQETLRASVKYINKNIRTYHSIARQIGTTPGSVEFLFPSNYNNVGHLHSLFLNFAPIISQTSLSVLEQNYDGSTSKAQSLSQNTKFKTIITPSESAQFNIDFEIYNALSFENFFASYLEEGQKYIGYNEWGANIEFPFNSSTQTFLSTRYEFNTYQLVSAVGVSSSKDGWNYFFSYAQGYRPPSLTQKYSQVSYFVGNKNLLPEKSDEFSAGFDKTYNLTNFRFEAFHRTMTDLLENRTISPGVQQARNVGKALAQGFDLSAYTDIDGVIIKSSLNYLQNKNMITNEPITFSPQTQITISLEKSFKFLTPQVSTTYWSDYYDRNATTGSLVALPSWIIVNASLKKQLTTQLELMVSVFNITDQPREFTLGYPEPQRSFKVALRGQF